MTLASWLVIGPAIAYSMAAASHAWNGRIGWAITWGAYALANVGLIMAQEGK